METHHFQQASRRAKPKYHHLYQQKAMGARVQETYSDDFRAAALTLVEASGGKGHVMRVADQLGIPVSTLHHWFATSQKQNETPEFARTRDIKKGELVDLLESLVLTALGVLDDADKLSSAQVHHVSTVMGTAFDKLQLLKGEATQRTETTIERGIYTDLRYIPDVEEAEIVEELRNE